MTTARDAYVDGLAMLARRELSEAQLRQRLARKGHDDAEIDRAVDRLREEKAVDDVRVADAIARTEATLGRRGRMRVRMKIEGAGVAKATAERAVADAFQGIDDQTLIDACIDKRLRGRPAIADDREFARLYRSLIGRGFDHHRVLAALNARRRARDASSRVLE
jgi:regulatory protein